MSAVGNGALPSRWHINKTEAESSAEVTLGHFSDMSVQPELRGLLAFTALKYPKSGSHSRF